MKIEKIRHKVAKALRHKEEIKNSVPLCLCASVPNKKGFTPLEIDPIESLNSTKIVKANGKVKVFSDTYRNVKRHFLSLTGFTLMELMVVIAIIVLLAGIMTPNVARRLERAKMTRAEADIAAIEGAIAMYENDLGTYPPTGIDYLDTCLTGRDGISGPYKPADNPKWHGPYIKGIDKDSWKEEYEYTRTKPNTNEGGPGDAPANLGYYIYSKGKNKKTTATDGNNKDDINNWDVKSSWREEY